MPQFSSEFWMSLVMYGVSIGVIYGTFKAQLSSLSGQFTRLEEKVDKHNSVVERMAVAERDLKSAWKQIDEIKEDIREEK